MIMQQQKQITGFILVFIWMSAIFLFSAQNAAMSDSQSAAIVDAINHIVPNAPESVLTFLTRKAAHIFMFFVLGVLVFSTIWQYELKSRTTIFVSILWTFLYACTDEIHQLFVPGRSGEVRDTIIDTTAASLGVLISYWWVGIYEKRKENHEQPAEQTN